MTSFSLDALIDELPAGLERCLLRALTFHVGRENAIGRSDLLQTVRRGGFSRLSDRQLRAQINQLRKAGTMICSAAGEEGGYYLSSNWDELNEYLQREVHSRAMDLLEQEQSLRQAAEKRWGRYSPEKQGSLF